MAINCNNSNDVKEIKYNNSDVKVLKMGSTVVWSKPITINIQQATNGTISVTPTKGTNSEPSASDTHTGARTTLTNASAGASCQAYYGDYIGVTRTIPSETETMVCEDVYFKGQYYLGDVAIGAEFDIPTYGVGFTLDDYPTTKYDNVKIKYRGRKILKTDYYTNPSDTHGWTIAYEGNYIWSSGRIQIYNSIPSSDIIHIKLHIKIIDDQMQTHWYTTTFVGDIWSSSSEYTTLYENTSALGSPIIKGFTSYDTNAKYCLNLECYLNNQVLPASSYTFYYEEVGIVL